MAFHGRLFRIETVNLLKVRCVSIEPLSIDSKMPVVANLNALTPQSDQAFDVELILRQSGNAFGFEHNDFPALRWTKVIGDAVHEKMIAIDDAQLHHLLALLEILVLPQTGTSFEC